MLASVFLILVWHLVGAILLVLISGLIDIMGADVPRAFGVVVLIICLPIVALFAALIIVFDRSQKEESE